MRVFHQTRKFLLIAIALIFSSCQTINQTEIDLFPSIYGDEIKLLHQLPSDDRSNYHALAEKDWSSFTEGTSIIAVALLSESEYSHPYFHWLFMLEPETVLPSSSKPFIISGNDITGTHRIPSNLPAPKDYIIANRLSVRIGDNHYPRAYGIVRENQGFDSGFGLNRVLFLLDGEKLETEIAYANLQD